MGRRKQKNVGLFGPPKSKLLSEIVRIDTPKNAEESVKTLIQMFKTTDDPKWRLHIRRAIHQAYARAKVMSENPRVSPAERREAKEVAKIYRLAYWRLDHKTGKVYTKQKALKIMRAHNLKKARKLKKPKKLKKLMTLKRRR